MRKILLGLAIAACALPAAAQSVRAGIDAWQKGDATSAVAIWKPLAEKGDPDAAFNVGQAYRLGKGVKLDLAQAQIWLERAARKGHVDAQATLGLLLFQNGNRVSAMRWLKGAARAGEPRAMLVVGTALYNGDGVDRDPVTAYAYVSRAAAQGLGPAKATLADLDAAMSIDQRERGVALAEQMMATKKPASKSGANQEKKLALKKTAPKTAGKVEPPKPSIAPKQPIPSPSSPAAAAGGWRVQLGAFGQRATAEALFSRLSPKLAGRRAFLVPVGKIVRLQVGPFESRAAASAACARLKPQACFPVEGS